MISTLMSGHLEDQKHGLSEINECCLAYLAPIIAINVPGLQIPDTENLDWIKK